MIRPRTRAIAALALLIGLLAARQAVCRPCAADASILVLQLESVGVGR